MTAQSEKPNETIPWIGFIADYLKEEGHLELFSTALDLKNNPSLFVFSDYGGVSADCEYNSYSFLLIGAASLKEWYPHVYELKEDRFKTMDYKGLHSGQKRRALSNWLRISDEKLPGVLFCLLVNKHVETLIEFDEMSPSEALKSVGVRGYTEKVARKLILIVHYVCFLTSLVKPASKLLWKTDEDDIAGSGGDGQLEDAFKLFFSRVAVSYELHSQFGDAMRVHCRKFSEPKSQMIEDALSLPDLAAGILADASSKNRVNRAVANERPEIWNWLSQNQGKLKKLIFRLEHDETTNLGYRIFHDHVLLPFQYGGKQS